MHEPKMTRDEVEAFLRAEFPQMYLDGEVFSIDAIEPGSSTITLTPGERHLRPGGTISGPTLFTLADVAAYAVTLAHVGPVALAVTTNLNIDFLRRPELGPLTCVARLLKLGRRLVVVSAAITDEPGRLVAHATATYSVPPR